MSKKVLFEKEEPCNKIDCKCIQHSRVEQLPSLSAIVYKTTEELEDILGELEESSRDDWTQKDIHDVQGVLTRIASTVLDPLKGFYAKINYLNLEYPVDQSIKILEADLAHAQTLLNLRKSSQLNAKNAKKYLECLEKVAALNLEGMDIGKKDLLHDLGLLKKGQASL